MHPDRLPGLLGLARRAGLTVSGTDAVVSRVRRKEARCVLIDAGASDNTRKKLADACRSYKTRCFIVEEGLLDRACGLSDGRSLALLKGTLTDEIIRLLPDNDFERVE